MSNTVIRPKDRAEWLEYRKDGIGSSEVATILGLNPWETPYQLWRRKKGLDAPKDETFAMKAGHISKMPYRSFGLTQQAERSSKVQPEIGCSRTTKKGSCKPPPTVLIGWTATETRTTKGYWSVKQPKCQSTPTTCRSIGSARFNTCSEFRNLSKVRWLGSVPAENSGTRTSHLFRTSSDG